MQDTLLFKNQTTDGQQWSSALQLRWPRLPKGRSDFALCRASCAVGRYSFAESYGTKPAHSQGASSHSCHGPTKQDVVSETRASHVAAAAPCTGGLVQTHISVQKVLYWGAWCQSWSIRSGRSAGAGRLLTLPAETRFSLKAWKKVPSCLAMPWQVASAGPRELLPRRGAQESQNRGLERQSKKEIARKMRKKPLSVAMKFEQKFHKYTRII